MRRNVNIIKNKSEVNMTQTELIMLRTYNIYLSCERLKAKVKADQPRYYRHISQSYYYNAIADEYKTSYMQVARCVSRVLKCEKKYRIVYETWEKNNTKSLEKERL